MNVSYDDARLIAQAFLDLREPGCRTVAEGWQDAEAFYVPYVAADGSPLIGSYVLFVRKADAELEVLGEYIPGLPHAARLEAMTPVR